MNNESPLQRLLKTCPILPFLGLGIWIAHVSFSNGGSVWLSDTEINGENIAALFAYQTISSGLVFLGLALCPPKVRKLLSERRFVLWSGVISMLGCMVVILIGPYYLHPYLSDFLRIALFVVGGSLSGLGLGVICLKCGMLYGGLTPRTAMVYTSLAYAFSSALFFFEYGAPDWAPMPGGPSLVGILTFTLTPVVGAILVTLPDHKRLGYGKDEIIHGDEGLLTRSESLEHHRWKMSDFPVSFWKLLVMVFIFAFITYAVREYVIQSSPVEDTLGRTRITITAMLLGSLAFAVFAATYKEGLKFGQLFFVIIVGSVLLVALLPLFGVSQTILSQVVALASFIFEMLFWCILAFIVYQRKLPAALVFGLGFGTYLLGCGLGWTIGAELLNKSIATFGPIIPNMGMALLILASASILFSRREFDLLFASSEDMPSLDELMKKELEPAGRSYRSGGTGEVDGDSPEGPVMRKGAFNAATEAIAQEFGLSPRELDILRSLARGYDANTTAEKLSISWNTVRTHIRNVYNKLDVHSHQELIVLVDARCAAMTPEKDEMRQ